MVSIIIPNYNRANYLRDTLQSILNQTSDSWEALVVDDGSTDNSKQVVDEFHNQNSKIIWIDRIHHLKGASVCRNIGVEHAKGNFVIFLDSDDLLAPNCIAQRLKIMESHPNLDFTVFQMQFFKEHPGDDSRIWNLDTGEDVLQRFLNLDAVWQTTGPIWKIDALKAIGLFEPKLQCWQDIDLHLKALTFPLTFKLFYDLPIDCWYRKDSAHSISQSNTNSLVKLESKRILLEWVKAQPKLETYDHLVMVIHVLVSGIQGMQFNFFMNFYNQIKSVLPKKIKCNIILMALIRFSRSIKLKFMQSKYNQLKMSVVSNNSAIGKYHV
ncbi:glycosyltransferase family 2 protein [Formosa algae]|uniref:Glycosyltransferase involved in cell wall biosynthesis n=1 Tax=Formosa algae TaxID=225843 RepID=A0A9X1C8D6_9FLAO|nr:glycosyltransferase family 2 protein [Formosa algae]MBP1839116.1 glycosyltransferase involved in cell wall biosynthesis [Formosa algae]MDQ0333893.1 glycosyltransferase involved in cell wall biosynthesis [Formosa algae]OEI79316.1 hypothetical protein AST99_15200 [Formosa algae]